METRLLIGGELVAGDGGQLPVENPYTLETLAEVGRPSPAQTDAALAAAAEAFRPWASTPAVERAELLHEVARRLRDRQDELAELMTLEGGKPRVENSDEIGWVAACFDYYAEIGRNPGRPGHPAHRVHPARARAQRAARRRGGDRPVELPAPAPGLEARARAGRGLHRRGQALGAHPALDARSRAAASTTCPPGAVNILAGGGDVGEAHRRRRPGRPASRSPARPPRASGSPHSAAQRVARVNLEMGGKDPFLVLPDVAEAIGVAARGGAWAAFLNAGQVCTSAERFYVARPGLRRLRRRDGRLHARPCASAIPLVPTTDLGPLVSAPQREKVAAQVDAAAAAGAELVTGGGAAVRRTGHFYAPAVVTGAPGGDRPPREETFGPVAPVVRGGSLDEAIALANASPYGLGANVYTQDLDAILRCMRELKAGTVWINDPLTDNDAGPFGGFKQSGLGRELGQEGLEAFQETKHVHLETRIGPKDWWYPYGR